jgi:hypothetical protein
MVYSTNVLETKNVQRLTAKNALAVANDHIIIPYSKC